MTMKKIIIIGSGGAGKSTLARRLGAITGSTVIHLDKVYWQPNWNEPNKSEWQKTVEEMLADDAWIMDGNFGGTLAMRIEASDTVILLDLPRTVCLYRVLKRFATYRNKTRPDMADGCHEKIDLEFLMWIWNYPNKNKPKVEKLLQPFQDSKTIIRLKSTKAVENFLVNYSKKSC